MSYLVSHHFSMAFHSAEKKRIMCLIRSHALTASRPILTIVVIQSGLSYCQVFSSTYILYILFLPIFFTSFGAFMFSLFSDDLCWLLIGLSLLEDLFQIWLFSCLVVLRVSIFYIANWLLFVWTCVSIHNLADCHFHNIRYKWYNYVICLDLCQKSQSDFLVSAKS